MGENHGLHSVKNQIPAKFRFSYLDIADAFCNRGCGQHGKSGNDACSGEDAAELAFGQAEFALKKVYHPGPGPLLARGTEGFQ